MKDDKDGRRDRVAAIVAEVCSGRRPETHWCFRASTHWSADALVSVRNYEGIKKVGETQSAIFRIVKLV